MKNCNSLFLTLDIETSTKFDTINGEQTPVAVWLSYGVCKVITYKGECISKLRFREWEELVTYLDVFAIDHYKYKVLCFVHNLAYEFDFLIKNISRPQTILSNATHKIISSTLERYKNIEFRCTYQMSGYSLAKLGDLIGLKKLDSDYRTIYPYDEVTEEEWIYCERDNDIVAKYVIQTMKEYGRLSSIPYTKTGRVRKKLKELYAEQVVNEWDYMPPPDCIDAMEKAFAGGIVILNPLYANKKLYKVKCYDIVSSYPFVILSEKFPQKIEKLTPDRFNRNEMFIAKIKYHNISTKYTWSWLSKNKMENPSLDCEFFNGKIIQGSSVERYVTNIDFDLIEQTYSYSDYEILEYYRCYNVDYLPECFYKLVEYYGEIKGRLKEEKGKAQEFTDEFFELEKEYMLAKNDFNAIYGMMVEKLTKDTFTVDENYLWKREKGGYDYSPTKHLKRNFLFGLYITAYARRNILRFVIKNCGNRLVYIDTDSAKFIDNGQEIIDTNGTLIERFANNKYLCELGRFDYEGIYEESKFMGAKKYCYKKKDKKTGEYHIVLVVAGLPKSDEYNLQDVDEFYDGRVFENCKLGTSYFYLNKEFYEDDDDNIIMRNTRSIEFMEEHGIKGRGGVILYPTSYKLSITILDKRIIDIYQTAGKKEVYNG